MTRPVDIPKPVPKVTELNRPFYEGATRGELHLQRCQKCGRWVYFPRVACPFCLADHLMWARASGRGTVHSFALVYRPQHPSFNRDVPINLAAVVLEEGPVVIAEIAEAEPDSVTIGMPVEACWERRSDEVAVLRFRPVIRAEVRAKGPERL